jgi:hypothetical protein
MKTRRLGSRAGWRRMKTRRALATSGRSPACAGAGSARPRVGSFFARQVVGTKKPMHRTQPDRDPARGRKCAADFLQGQVGLPGNQLQHPRSVLAQPGATVATHRARARMALGPPALRPADGAADADIKPHRRRPCAAAKRHKTDHTLPQILRVRSRHNRLQWHGPAAASTISTGLKIPFLTRLPDRQPL